MALVVGAVALADPTHEYTLRLTVFMSCIAIAFLASPASNWLASRLHDQIDRKLNA